MNMQRFVVFLKIQFPLIRSLICAIQTVHKWCLSFLQLIILYSDETGAATLLSKPAPARCRSLKGPWGQGGAPARRLQHVARTCPRSLGAGSV